MTLLGDYATLSQVSRNYLFPRYMQQNHASWLKFAISKGFAVQESDLILVYGCVKTSQWALAAFHNHGRSHKISFDARAGVFSAARFEMSAATSSAASIAERYGPQAMNRGIGTSSAISSGEKDQCLFLRYYKFKTRLLMSPKIVTTVHARDAQGSSPDDYRDYEQQQQSSTRQEGFLRKLLGRKLESDHLQRDIKILWVIVDVGVHVCGYAAYFNGRPNINM